MGVTAILKPGTLPHVQLIESKAASEALIRVAEGLTQQRHALQSYLEGPPTAILKRPRFQAGTGELTWRLIRATDDWALDPGDSSFCVEWLLLALLPHSSLL